MAGVVTALFGLPLLGICAGVYAAWRIAHPPRIRHW